jgi:hypothetical protein
MAFMWRKWPARHGGWLAATPGGVSRSAPISKWLAAVSLSWLAGVALASISLAGVSQKIGWPGGAKSVMTGNGVMLSSYLAAAKLASVSRKSEK